MLDHGAVAGRMRSAPIQRRLGRDTFVLLALTGFVVVLVARMAAPPIVMLVTSLALLVAAASLALGAWMRGAKREEAHYVSAWDWAGLLILLGFAAALVSDSMELMTSLETASASAP